jgi:hypothetical protein
LPPERLPSSPVALLSTHHPPVGPSLLLTPRRVTSDRLVELKIRPIRDGKSRLGRAFFAFPFGLYRDTPQWVLPFARGIRRIIEQKHPFFAHSRGEAFVITEGDRVVARFLMLEPVKYNRLHRQPRRTPRPSRGDRPSRRLGGDVRPRPGMGACPGRPASHRTAALLSHGRLGNPCGRVRSSRFDDDDALPPPLGGGSLRSGGISKYKDFVSARAASEGFVVPDKIRRVAEISGRRSGMTVETLRGRGELRRLGREIGELYNRAWEDHAEFRPLTTAELAGLVDDLVTVATPELITVLRGRAAAISPALCYPFPI